MLNKLFISLFSIMLLYSCSKNEKTISIPDPKEKSIEVWGSGDQRRSYIHALDCARIMHLIMENVEGNVISNIGTKETISVSELT